jgi:hypothetical protein
VFHRVVLSYQRDLVTDAADVAVDVALDPYVGSFDTFVRERGAGLCRLAYLLTGDHQLAEDLVQTALAKVSPKWDRIAGKGDPGPYVRQVMLRTTIGWRRRRWHGETPTAPLPERHEADATGAVETREREAPAPVLPDCAAVPPVTKSLPEKAALEPTTVAPNDATGTSVSSFKGEGTITAVRDDRTLTIDVETAARPSTDAKGQPAPSAITLTVDDRTMFPTGTGDLAVGAHVGIYAVLVDGTTYHAESLFFDIGNPSATKSEVSSAEKQARANAEDATEPLGLLKGKGTITGAPSSASVTIAVADDGYGRTRTITLGLDAETSYYFGATECTGAQLADGQVIGFAATRVDDGSYRANEILLG